MVAGKKEFRFFVIVVTLVVVLDQLMKWFIQKVNPQWNFSLFEIHLITNTGAGFGILQNKTLLLAMFSFLVAVVILWNYRKIPKERFAQICVALFLGGVLGNFIDRAFRGLVIDFIDLRFWPAFNLADMTISVAVVGLMWYSWRMGKEKKISELEQNTKKSE